MAKINLDKYYTPVDLAEYVVNKTKEIIGEENITEYLEPSAGAGVFLGFLGDNYLAYDIEPEDDKNKIVKQDYLGLDLEYKKGRCVIGNPPYGNRLNLAVQFYKKSLIVGDYIVFILPISQLNNNIKMYEFDLIHSEDLNKKWYVDRNVHCCLNIYRRNKNGLNKKVNYKLKDVEIQEFRRCEESRKNKKLENFEYDIRICSWGNPVGKVVDYPEQYNTEFCIKIKDGYKDQVTKLLKTVKWEEIYQTVTNAGKLNQWQVYKYIKDNIEGIE